MYVLVAYLELMQIQLWLHARIAPLALFLPSSKRHRVQIVKLDFSVHKNQLRALHIARLGPTLWGKAATPVLLAFIVY